MSTIVCRTCGKVLTARPTLCPGCGTRLRRSTFERIVLTLAGGLVAFFLLCVGVAMYTNPPADRPSPLASASPTSSSKADTLVPAKAATKHEPTAAENKRYNVCKTRLTNASTDGLLVDLKAVLPPKIFVGPRWALLSLPQKESFMDDVNCFLVHGSTEWMTFDIVNGLSGKRIGVYRFGTYTPD